MGDAQSKGGERVYTTAVPTEQVDVAEYDLRENYTLRDDTDITDRDLENIRAGEKGTLVLKSKH